LTPNSAARYTKPLIVFFNQARFLKTTDLYPASAATSCVGPLSVGVFNEETVWANYPPFWTM
jgi:hypothetical protein